MNQHKTGRHPIAQGYWMAVICSCLLFSTTDLMGQKKCLSHSLRDKLMQSDPEYSRQRAILERQIQQYIAGGHAREAATVNIPVVFQVIHNGDPIGSNENISDAQIMAQLDQLNADFGRTNTDAGNTPTAFQGVAANTMIQFCLATMDPNGQATTGILRHNLPLNQSACWNADFIDNNIVDGRAWDTQKYLNIFIVREIQNDECTAADILGYASFPGGDPDLDVAVHAVHTIGSLSSPNPAGGAFGMGRTVTHEVGHWLNLDHVWGNGGCGSDDQVADTPLQDDASSDCPNFPMTDNCTTSGNGIMFMNYMDYVDDDCMNMFSQGQATRMMAAINASRPMLLNSQCGMTGGGSECTDYMATDVPVNIPGNITGDITSTINVATGGVITDINIKNLTGTHTYVGDLTFTLTSPENTSVVLIENKCNDDNTGFNINLDDQAAIVEVSCPLSDGHTERPDNPLSAFNGENPMGNWTLTINDNFDEDGGSLSAWTLEICIQSNGGDCPTNRMVDDTPIATGTYQAGTQLTSKGTVATGSNVTFRAGNNVQLNPDFITQTNATLEIRIEGCQ